MEVSNYEVGLPKVLSGLGESIQSLGLPLPLRITVENVEETPWRKADFTVSVFTAPEDYPAWRDSLTQATECVSESPLENAQYLLAQGLLGSIPISIRVEAKTLNSYRIEEPR